MNSQVAHLPTVALRVAIIATLKPVLRFDLRSQITPMSKLIEDLSMDSLDRQTVACELEEAFGLELGDDAVASWCTVEDIARSIEATCNLVLPYPRDFTVVETGGCAPPVLASAE